jgi:hypothetical protein
MITHMTLWSRPPVRGSTKIVVPSLPGPAVSFTPERAPTQALVGKEHRIKYDAGGFREPALPPFFCSFAHDLTRLSLIRSASWPNGVNSPAALHPSVSGPSRSHRPCQKTVSDRWTSHDRCKAACLEAQESRPIRPPKTIARLRSGQPMLLDQAGQLRSRFP